MPIIYIHGVAVRNRESKAPEIQENKLLEHLLEDITWEMVEQHLRQFIAPEIAADPQSVSLMHAYWGDLGAQFAWGGESFMMDAAPAPEAHVLPHPSLPTRSHILAELRRPLNQLGARFFGDVFCYLNNRGNASAPGAIPQRVLDALAVAQGIKEQTGEPIIVLTNSMGGQIMYDIVTHFLPGIPQYADLHIDFWCSVASQIGLFEELKLFLNSSNAYSKDKGNQVPFPDRKRLGIWWNVWDMDDVISYSVRGIIEGVEETQFRVGQILLKEHVGYLQEDSFYRLFAERIRQAFPANDAIPPPTQAIAQPDPAITGKSSPA